MKLTQKHFERFVNYCIQYQAHFKLHDWALAFEFKDLQEDRARTVLTLEASQAVIGLNTNWNEDVRKFAEQQLREVAKHEMLHVFLGRLGELARYRYLTSRELEAAEHAIIQKLLFLIPD